MTCVIAIRSGASVVMGADSAASNSRLVQIRSDGKIIRKNGFLIGTAGSIRIRDVIQHLFEPPAVPVDGCTHAYMVAVFVPRLRAVLTENDALITHDENAFGGELLVAHQDNLYIIDEDFHVGTPATRYIAIGSAASEAMVGAACLSGFVVDAKQRAVIVLEAVAHTVHGVRPPFDVYSTGEA